MNAPCLVADLGGTAVKLGVVVNDRVLATDVQPAPKDRLLGPHLGELAALLKMLADRAGVATADCSAVALSLPSLVDEAQQHVSPANDKYADIAEIDLNRWARTSLSLKSYVANDANAALAGEWQFGAGRGVQDVVLLTLGTGIGTSVVMEGIPLRGRRGRAGCLGGHFCTDPQGPRCTCGLTGCIEARASTWALSTMSRVNADTEDDVRSIPPADYAAVFRLAEAGDPEAQNLRDRSIAWWSVAALNMVCAYDPSLLILTGGVMRAGDHVTTAVESFLHDRRHEHTRVVRGDLGDAAALLGLGWLATHRTFTKPI